LGLFGKKVVGMQGVNSISSDFLKQVPTGLVIVEKNNGRFIYANKRAIELIGFNPWGLTFREYALNKAKISKLNNSTCGYEELPLTRALMLGETCRNEELTLQRPNQTELSVSLNASPLMDNKGEVIGALALFEDITAHKKLKSL
jgi:PAS domain S-box-containing protein